MSCGDGTKSQTFHQINQQWPKLCKNVSFFIYKTLALLKHRSKADVSTHGSVQQMGVFACIMSGSCVLLCTFVRVWMVLRTCLRCLDRLRAFFAFFCGHLVSFRPHLASVVSLGASCAAGPPPYVQSKRSHRPSQHHDVYSGINCF